MLWSKTFIPTLRDIPQEAESASHRLMLRAGLTRMLVAGVYSYLPLGLKVLNNIKEIIRQEMKSVGAVELLLPSLQPQELWDKTARNSLMEEIMIRFTDRRGRKMCLGPTHEEIITELAAGNINSYKQLPLILYQIQTKFRDEMRPRFGLVRSCEFIMKDAYSFDIDEKGLDNNYALIYEAYLRIFKRCGLNTVVSEADSGVMGGKVSHEFMVIADSGEDSVYVCGKCANARSDKAMKCGNCGLETEEKKAIEIGHIFKLGAKYSQPLSAFFTDESGARRPMIMGCYGIGVSRMIAAIIEANHDQEGIIWPGEVSPFDVLVMPLNMSDERSKEEAFKLYDNLGSLGLAALLDDRDERSGVKFNDADLIGVPFRVVIGQKNLRQNKVELQKRKDKSLLQIDISAAGKRILDEIKNKLR